MEEFSLFNYLFHHNNNLSEDIWLLTLFAASYYSAATRWSVWEWLGIVWVEREQGWKSLEWHGCRYKLLPPCPLGENDIAHSRNSSTLLSLPCICEGISFWGSTGYWALHQPLSNAMGASFSWGPWKVRQNKSHKLGTITLGTKLILCTQAMGLNERHKLFSLWKLNFSWLNRTATITQNSWNRPTICPEGKEILTDWLPLETSVRFLTLRTPRWKRRSCSP